ncbi:MAG: EF-P lysine aminoacylase GenX [bacterium]|nr:EF-P lysine aminoacylase GenX [bacterium]
MGELVDTGDWVAGRIARAADGSQVLEDAIVLAKRRAESPDPELPSRLPLLRGRAAVIDAARAHFSERGFLEVSTPTRVTCPGLEPHLDAFAVGDRWLITSPELHLKRMLAGGAEKVFEIARAFRDDERGPWHMPEFTLLEWYRAFEGLAAIEADCERLVLACAEAPGIEPLTALPGCDLSAPFDRTTVREALDEATGLDLAQLGERDALAAAVEKRGHRIDAGDSWDDVFFRVWIAEVEPGLGSKRPVFVHDYPASQAALARTHREDWGEVAERFELYINGVEVANAFHELNDPDEQRRRHEADRETRRAAGRDVYPLDEAFLAALEAGMPPAAGVALGLDRLAALLTGASSLESVTAFP